MPSKADTSLEKYREKRSTDGTPEPFGSRRVTGGSVFVIHHHAARNEHYDLRLEVDGVLWSWAVPRGISPDPADKRLAIYVESHPVDYAWFEDRIPEGNYGAGAMIIWDRGRWVPKLDPQESFADGKMLFELKGFKLHGTWTLIKTKRGEKEWLLIKERDQWVDTDPEIPADSILSGLTVWELKEGQNKAGQLRDELQSTAATRFESMPEIVPMLCKTASPFSDTDWVFEVKYDGYRILARKEREQVALLTRRGRDVARNFPEVAEAVAALPFDNFVLDGEVVVNDGAGLPSFARLQQRGQLQRATDIARAAVRLPAQLLTFDMPCAEGFDLRAMPLLERKNWLRRVLPTVGVLRYVDHVEGQGEALYQHAVGLGLEGLVGKKSDSAYEGTRADTWLKIRSLHTHDFAIIGFCPPRGQTQGLGSVYLASRRGSQWVCFGRAGSGLGEVERNDLLQKLLAAEINAPVCEVQEPRKDARWVHPEHVVEVRFMEFSQHGNLRQPVLLRIRDDRDPTDCVAGPWANDDIEPAVVTETLDRERVIFSNRDKIFWPDDGYTKGDLLDHYDAIAEWMLPHFADRPIVLTRYPDGIEAESFYQHRAPEYLPEWIRRETIWMEGDKEDRQYIIIDNKDTLLYLANLGTIPIHAWSARASDVQRPDYCVLDLDPKEAAFSDVVAVARTIHSLLDESRVPHFLKTSGSTGLHVLVPLNGQLTHHQCKEFGELLARIVVARQPEIATIQRNTRLRDGRVYVDYLQNGFGKTIAGPFCARPVPGGGVSMPLYWDELAACTGAGQYHIKNAAKRMRELGEDPLSGLLTAKLDLPAALAALTSL